MKNIKLLILSVLVATTFGGSHKTLGMENKIEVWEKGIRSIHKDNLWFGLIERIKQGEEEINLKEKHSWLGDKEAKALAQALPYSKIKDLNMMFGEIGDEGAIAFATILSETLPLESLQIYGNRIGIDGAKVLISKLPSSKVNHLDIGSNLNINYKDVDFNKFLKEFEESNKEFEVDKGSNGVTLIIKRK